MHNLLFADKFVELHTGELLREAENERLVALAAAPRRRLRVRIATWLRATAEWLEGRPELAERPLELMP
jgi:hypothetical protein